MNRPDWTKTILTRSKCVACSAGQAESQVLGVGITEPPSVSHQKLGPAFLVVVRCHGCGHSQVFFGHAPERRIFQQIIDQVANNAWTKYLDSRRSHRGDGPCPFDEMAMGLTNHNEPPAQPGAEALPRPSIRKRAPKTAIGDDEVRKFLRHLHRTSMRRSTQSFQRWLRRLTE